MLNDKLEEQKQRILACYGIQKSEVNDIEKGGKHGMVGEIREWNGKKFKKQSNGKWLEISESHGLTHKEHLEKIDSLEKQLPASSKDGGERKFMEVRNEQDKHWEAKKKLSDKEHDDSHFQEKEDKKESSSTKNIDSIKEKVFEWLGSGQGRNVPTGKVKELVKDLTTKELKEVGDSVQDQISNTEPDAWDYDTIEELGVIFKRQFNWEDPEA